MPDIVLKNILGQDVTYTGVDTVKLKNTAGGEETFSHGIAVEDVPIELNLANGETQTIVAPEGSLVKSAIVTVTGGGAEPVLNMPETALTFELDNILGIDVMKNVTPVELNYIIEGATYDVVWNGTPVTCVAWKGEYGGAKLIGIGNIEALMGSPTDVLFIIGTIDGTMTIIAMQAITSATVSVTLNLEAGGGGSGGGSNGIDDLLSADSFDIYSDTITNVANNALRATYDWTETRLKIVDLPNVTDVGTYAFAYQKGITKVNLPKVKTIGNNAFYNGYEIATLDISSVETIGNYSFYYCQKIAHEIILPSLTSVGTNAFQNCKMTPKFILPNVVSVGSSAFAYCEKAEIIDIGKMNSSSNACCQYCYSLKAFVIRSTTFCQAPGTNTFTSCYHILGTTNSTYNPSGAKDGYIYVPRALVDTYKTATYWSANASQFRPLEDYTVDGTIYGALDESKI